MSGFFSKPVTPTLASLGLDQINNTSDANKPVSTPQQTAIAAAVAPTRRLIASQGAPTANVTGTSTSTTYPVVAITIPANSVPGLNGFLEVKARINVNNSGSVKTVKAVLNNQDLGVTLQMVNLTSADLTIRIQNKGATNAQLVTNSASPNNAPTATTVDMTVAQNLTITCLLATAGDTCNVGPFSVEASNA